MQLGYHCAVVLTLSSTGPSNNAQSCPYLFRLNHDVRCMYITLEVVLPRVSSNFKVHIVKSCTCTV